MINKSDISIIIQGPIDWSPDALSSEGTTLTATRNARELFPSAEIILSTWEGERVDGLVYDKIIFSKPPEAQGVWPTFTSSNVNRQIVCTSAGLNIASRKYCLKIRTDMIITGEQFLRVFEEKCSNRVASNVAIFDQPVIANNFSSRNTSSILERIPDHPLPFHPSDHLQFGTRKDIKFLWDVEFQSDEDGYYFLDMAYPNRWRLNELSRFTPEQFIFISAIRKRFPVDIEDYADMRSAVIAQSEHYLDTHFVFIPDRDFPVRFAKYHTDHHFSFEWMRRSNL